MAKRGVNLEAFSQIFIDRFRLGRRFDNDNVHTVTNLNSENAGIYCDASETFALQLAFKRRLVKGCSI
jgi:hypothetical protein